MKLSTIRPIKVIGLNRTSGCCKVHKRVVELLCSRLVAGVMMADGLQLGPPATPSSGWCWPYNQAHKEKGEEKR